MKPQKEPKPELADTLSERVTQLREKCNMTILDLARACRLSVKRIEAIESGSEVWLSVTERTILAKALRVVPSVIKEVEICPSQMKYNTANFEPSYDAEELAERVLAGEVNLACPKCGQVLKTTVENAIDFEGNPTTFARAYCPKCPFALH
ncbi:MAG: hypothetical protein K2X81_04665 [Candidatus Obscuribacterales bacterium]|nr:hypothetical protein [Candidatus Obscuribacterales bacterium]